MRRLTRHASRTGWLRLLPVTSVASADQLHARVIDTTRVTEMDADKVRSTLRQCVRDWADEVSGLRSARTCL